MWGQRQDGQSEWRCQRRKCRSCDRSRIQIDDGGSRQLEQDHSHHSTEKEPACDIVGLVGKILS